MPSGGVLWRLVIDPYEGTFRHFLKPPKLGRLHGLG